MWTLNGIRIFAQQHRSDSSQIIPRLQPLGGGTVLQFFGYESRIISVSAIIVGDADLNALRNLRKTATAYELVSPEGSQGDFYVKKVSHSRRMSICQTMRPDLPEDAPVYDIDIELYPESD